MPRTWASSRPWPAPAAWARSTTCSSRWAPLISRFAQLHPQVAVQLQLLVNPPPPTDDAFDVCIRFGAPPDARIIARRITPNRRLLCAAPAYLAAHGTPRVPSDLTRQRCTGIRQGEAACGLWRLTSGRGLHASTDAVKTRGMRSTNDGEIAVQRALDGQGILMRAEWDIARHLRSGALVQVLPQCHTPDADNARHAIDAQEPRRGPGLFHRRGPHVP